MQVDMLIYAGCALTAIISIIGWWRAHREAEYLDRLNSDHQVEIQRLAARLFPLEVKEQNRLAHCRKAAALGKAAQIAKAAEAAKGREKASQRTLNEFAQTKMRSRAKVVAPVKAKRTKIKKSAGGVAPKQAG